MGGLQIKWNNNDKIKEIKFVLENCESLTIPIECFKELDIDTTEDICELKAHILDNSEILSGMFTDNSSPCQRISHHNDIICICIILKNGEIHEYDVAWDDADGQENSYQKSKFISYKEIKLSINKNNKKLSIREVLELEGGTMVADEDGNEYRVEEDDCKYLFDTIVTDKIINSKFVIK